MPRTGSRGRRARGEGREALLRHSPMATQAFLEDMHALGSDLRRAVLVHLASGPLSITDLAQLLKGTDSRVRAAARMLASAQLVELCVPVTHPRRFALHPRVHVRRLGGQGTELRVEGGERHAGRIIFRERLNSTPGSHRDQDARRSRADA